MSYTYDLHQDGQGFDTLTLQQQILGRADTLTARDHGGDRADLLRQAVADTADKAALAELWGGPGAGAEFLR